MKSIRNLLLLMILYGALFTGTAWAQVSLSTGETVYVPVYSNVYHGPKARPLEILAILSIRNTDPVYSLAVTTADYFNTKGTLVKHHLEKHLTLPPLGSANFKVPEQDESGGAGASFIVRWHADTKINQPIIQAIMISTRSSLGISFICPGQIITEHK